MILHFIFVVKEEEREERQFEYEYVKKMAQFFKVWIKEKFGKDYEIQCDEMITKPTSILQRLDTHTLLRDHEQRGKDIYHFYLTHFRPMWTDCTCEGYHAENFGMVYWLRPKEPNDELYLAEKNCTTVSHEILHEQLRQMGRKKHAREVHDIWTKHIFEQLEFEQYDNDFKKTDGKPTFLAMDTRELNL
ncbi:hypothetical protein Nisw_06540 [Candidatus Nitrosopumilus sp. SW]|uniref:hypothetical protein n=1 Tax=Candidatus Nitrosopumilus sp. SW TaxID=2508726 RepID=UPI001151774B|nr:hypothetical protein [Candidatus Nitrosopumilus sp. SW]QDI89203.1 hypothetical protein Nisw_06540 [Candidatus Nitrosopumilus sp. SW]